jgi:hypothetical protein
LRGRGATRGDSVSSHLRFGIAGFFLVAGFSTPAFSNAFTDLFSANAAPAPSAAAAAPAKEEACLPQPGRSAAAGQHWVYRFDGQRKCWFQAAAEETALARKPVRHRLERRSVAASEDDKPAPRQQKDVEDAHAEMPGAAPEQTPQPVPLEPKLTIVHTVPVRIGDAAAMVPPAPDLDKPGADQLTPDQPRRPDVETLLAKAPAASEEVASAPPATPVAAPAAKTGGGEDGTPSWLGALMIVLGGAALLSASPALRQTLLAARFSDAGTELPVIAHGGRDEPSLDWSASVSPASGETRLPAAPHRPSAAVPPREVSWDEAIGAVAALTTPVSPDAFYRKARNRLARRGAAR